MYLTSLRDRGRETGEWKQAAPLILGASALQCFLSFVSSVENV